MGFSMYCDTCISNIDNTSHEEETSNNRCKTKSLHCPQLDHHDTDGLAGHKTWRTTQTTMRRYKYAIYKKGSFLLIFYI
jgi:hypothetical protein